MNEKEFTVLLTEQQEVKILACESQRELFATARDLLGCEWIELVEPDDPALRGYLMLIDEEGKLRNGTVWVNCVASDLSGSDWHGDFIVGNAMIVRAEGEHLTLLTKDEAEMLAEKLEGMREMSIDTNLILIDILIRKWYNRIEVIRDGADHHYARRIRGSQGTCEGE